MLPDWPEKTTIREVISRKNPTVTTFYRRLNKKEKGYGKFAHTFTPYTSSDDAEMSALDHIREHI